MSDRLPPPEHHRRLLACILDAGEPFGLALMGGYAFRAHGIVTRPSQDLDFATETAAPMAEIVDRVTATLAAHGWQITVIDVTPLKARFVAHDPGTRQACEVDLLKEVLRHPPVLLEPGPVLARDDLVATKVRALADRGLPRDAIDIHALRHDYTIPELENLGARRPDEWDLRELRDRLESLEWVSDDEFTAYGLTHDTITDLRIWANRWLRDLTARLGSDDEEDA